MNAESSEKFCNHALNLVNSGLTALALSLGKELGLVNLLCKVFEHPVTIKELADKGGLKERFVGVLLCFLWITKIFLKLCLFNHYTLEAAYFFFHHFYQSFPPGYFKVFFSSISC